MIYKERSLTNIKKEFEELINKAHRLEDLTNYDIKELGSVISILQNIDLDKEFDKYNTGGKK